MLAPVPTLRAKRRKPRLPARLRTRRAPVRRPGIRGALGAADQAALRWLRTKAPHDPATETVFKTLGTVGEYAAVWIAVGLAGAAADERKALALAARSRDRARRRCPQLRGQARDRPRAPTDRGPPAARPGAVQALVPVRALDVVVRRRHRLRAGRAAHPPPALRARERHLRVAPVSRHALPVRRPRRDRAGHGDRRPRARRRRAHAGGADARLRRRPRPRAATPRRRPRRPPRREDRDRRASERREVHSVQRAHPGGAETGDYPFTTIDPNVAVVPVPDERLERVAEVVGSSEVVLETIEFHDIAGLVRGASEGEGLGNRFLAAIRETDAICHVVRAHAAGGVPHPEGRVDPGDDIELIELELMAADLEQAQPAPRAGDEAGALARQGGGRGARLARGRRRRAGGRPAGSRRAGAARRARRAAPAPRADLEADPLRGERGRGIGRGARGRSPRTPRASAPPRSRSAPASSPSWRSSTTRARPRSCAASWASPSRA